MAYFPVFLKLKGRLALVVGGGAVAQRKVVLLRKAGARVRVVAPALAPALDADGANGLIEHLAEEFQPAHLDGAAVVIAATNKWSVNAQVSRHARLRGLPVNVVDDPELCSFIVPAIVDRSPVMVAVSTGGLSPVLSRWVRARIEAALPAALGRLAELAGGYRDIVRRRIPDGGARRRFWERLFDGPVPDLVFSRRDAEAETALGSSIAGVNDDGQVFLVGAGPGDPDLLTVRALRLLQSAEVIVHDRLVSDEILDLARRDADRVYVGKRRGDHVMTQADINALLVRLAREGKRVVRLKGGDPFVFGRGGEEMETLAQEGITCHVVPGITAATGCAAYAGIPLTHRDHAQHCVFVTGHGKDGEPDLNWDALARPAQTLVIYMGLRQLPTIARNLIDHGLAAATPAAIIENGTTPAERLVVGTIADLHARAQAAAVEGPALIIVGDVVSLARAKGARAEDLAIAV